MVSVNFYFQVHQPFRLNKYTVFDVGKNKSYFDDKKNRQIMQKIEKKCYLPMNNLLMDLIHKLDGKFKISFSISGTALEQFQEYSPAVLESFKELVKTGCVELLNETYYHSLSYLYSKKEFMEQLSLHKNLIRKTFKTTPQVFRNTELMYNNEIASFVESLGYKAVLAEGWDTILHWRSPNFVYQPVNCNKIKLLLKNYKLSDDIAFRFSNKGWKEHPLTVNKYVNWLNTHNGNGDLINLFMDYETFGEHQWADTGIFKFMRALPFEILKHKDNNFVTITEAVDKFPVRDKIDCHHTISWADMERDLSAWLGNKMQQGAINSLYALEKDVKSSNDEKLIDTWRKLTTSDHFYYMCTKWFSDGDVHRYFNPYDTPYDCYMVFMNILNDFILKLRSNSKDLNINPAFVQAKGVI